MSYPLKRNYGCRISDTKKGVGFGLVFDKEVFPYIWYWQEFRGGSGYPWWGKTYNIALEPWSSYPALGIPEAIKSSTQIRLKPKEKKRAWLKAVVYSGVGGVKRISPEGKVEEKT